MRVAMWSGPRNISTAMMRAFENRADTVVVDEPLYAAYLARTGIDHPAREAVIASQPTDVAEAVAGLSAPLPPGRSIHYAKHMAHHVSRDMDLDWTLRFSNVLLIRDPGRGRRLVRARPGHLRAGGHRPAPARVAAGSCGTSRGSRCRSSTPSDFLRAPEAHLRWLCDWLGIPFTARHAVLATRPAPVRRRMGAALVRRRLVLHRV